MSEALQVEVDGEIEEAGSSGVAGGSPRWGLPVAIGVAGVLLLAVLVVVVLPEVTGGTAAAPVAAGRGGQSRPVPQAGSTVVENKRVREDPRIVATRSAIEAWGAFATTGRGASLAPWFATDGPQYRLLQQEAAGLSTQATGEPAYAVEVKDPAVVARSRTEAVVAATVTWSRPGEASQEYRWEVVLRPGDRGRWVLWTVRQASG
jgi:hypothetical protein